MNPGQALSIASAALCLLGMSGGRPGLGARIRGTSSAAAGAGKVPAIGVGSSRHGSPVTITEKIQRLISDEHGKLSGHPSKGDEPIQYQWFGNSVTMQRLSNHGLELTTVWWFPNSETAVLRMKGEGELDIGGETIGIYNEQGREHDPKLSSFVAWTLSQGKRLYQRRSRLDPRIRSVSYEKLIQDEYDGLLVIKGDDDRLMRIEKDDLDGSKAARYVPAGQKAVPPLPVTIGRSVFGSLYRVRRTIRSHAPAHAPGADGREGTNQTSFYEAGFDDIEKFRVWSYQDPNILSVLTWAKNGSGVLNNLIDGEVKSYQIPALAQPGPYIQATRGLDQFLVSKLNPHKMSAPFHHILAEYGNRYLVENGQQWRWFVWKLGDPKEGLMRFRGEPVDDPLATGERILVNGQTQPLVLSIKEPRGWSLDPLNLSATAEMEASRRRQATTMPSGAP